MGAAGSIEHEQSQEENNTSQERKEMASVNWSKFEALPAQVTEDQVSEIVGVSYNQ